MKRALLSKLHHVNVIPNPGHKNHPKPGLSTAKSSFESPEEHCEEDKTDKMVVVGHHPNEKRVRFSSQVETYQLEKQFESGTEVEPENPNEIADWDRVGNNAALIESQEEKEDMQSEAISDDFKVDEPLLDEEMNSLFSSSTLSSSCESFEDKRSTSCSIDENNFFLDNYY
jgi:hypothetical protein